MATTMTDSTVPAPMTFTIDPAALTPLIRAVVTETIAKVEADRQRLDAARLCYSEHEAAALLGLEWHQLRDERRRGRIGSSSIVGRRIRYTRDDLLGYLAAGRLQSEA